MQQYLDSFLSLNDLELLNIPDTCLPIYTGPLPHKGGQIKKTFADRPSLKRVVTEKALCHMYSAFSHPLKVAILTWVMSDGLGDFSAQMEIAERLHKRLPPNSQITLITLYPETWNLPKLPFFEHFLIPYQEVIGKPGTLKKTVLFPENVIASIQKANVLLQVPTYFPETKRLLQFFQSDAPSYELIGEGGWSDTPRFHPQTGSRTLGFHFWEKGLFFPDLLKSPSLEFLSCPFLKKALSTYKPSDILSVAYLRNHTVAILLLKALLKQQEQSSASLFLCLFPCDGLLAEMTSLIPELKRFGIRQVEIFYETHFSTLAIQEKGKALKLVQMKKLPRSDYFILLNASNGLTGCRGDGSLAETLSAGKVPFPDLPPHKKELLKGLVLTCRHFLSDSHETTKYLGKFLEESLDYEAIGSLASLPQTGEGFKTLSEILKKHYQAEDFIVNLTLRAGAHHIYPELAFQEKISLLPFFFEDKKAYTAFQEIKSFINF